jgi:hypothetical protein
MQRHTTTSRLAAVGAAIAVTLVVGLAPAAGAAGSGAAPGTLPGETDTPFWPHETGVLVGTSETFVDMRADGSYYDPSLGRRVRTLSPDDRPFARSVGDLQPRTVAVGSVGSRAFEWEDGFIGGAFGLALALLGMGAILIAHRRRSMLRTG